MKRMHRIALRGMMGRKKDTAMLALVIAMSFLFLSFGTTLLSSLTRSQEDQRRALYGAWMFSDRGEVPVLSQKLREQDWLTAHDLQVLGTDPLCGSVSVWDDDFARMGGLQLIEGRTPEKPGEIVLEKGQLSLFPESVGIGSTVELTLNYSGDYSPELQDPEIPDVVELCGISYDMTPFYRMIANDLDPKALEEGIEEFVRNGCKLPPELPQVEFPMELPGSIEEMSEDEIRQMLDYIVSDSVFAYVVASKMPIRRLSAIMRPAGKVGAVSWEMVSDYALISAAPYLDNDRIPVFGALREQKLALKRECTVVGILETTADRWDVSEITVPNAYISPDTRQELQTCVEDLVQRPRPEWFNTDPNTVLTQKTFTFYETQLPVADAYKKMQTIPGNCLHPERIETIYDLGLYDQSMVPDEAEMRQQAGEAGLAAEEIRRCYYHDSAVYRLSFEGPDGNPVDAFFNQPNFTVRMKDESQQNFTASEGTLVYQTETGWENLKIDRDTLEKTNFAPEGCRSLGFLPESLEDAYAYNAQAIGINRYSYPSEHGFAAIMGSTLVVVLVVITVCAVFQIFFTQLRRRTRKLTLMRSIGATDGQIFQMLTFEGLYITAAGLVAGDSLGLLGAYAIAARMPDTVFDLDLKLFLTGQISGILSVAAGLLLPSIQAIRAPLVGRMTGKRRRHVKIKAMKRQTFPRICLRELQTNPGRTAGMAALCIFLITMQLICIFLGNAAFSTYRETVLDADKPDFTLTMNHAGSRRKIEPMQQALDQIPGLERVDFYRRGQRLFLWYEGMEESPVVQAVQETAASFMGSTKDPAGLQRESGLLTEIYAVDPDTPLFERIQKSLSEGTIDRDAYEAGEQVIVLLPMYAEQAGGGQALGDSFSQALQSSGRMRFRFDPAVEKLWQKDETIHPGKTLTLGTDSYVMREIGSGYTQTLKNVTVGGVIRTFSEDGIWPIAGAVQSHVIIGSRNVINRLYSDGFFTYDLTQMRAIDTRSAYFMPTEYGTAVWNLYARDDASVEQTLSPLSRFARQEHLTLHNFMDAKRAVYEKALSSAILAGTLAVAATLIVWMILFNTLNAAQEQGRSRTGILQSLGITRGQLYTAQILQCGGYWLGASIISNMVLLLIVVISGLIGQAGQNVGFAGRIALSLKEGFEAYPWQLHLAACAVNLPILLGFALHAARIPMRYSPIDNIRS